MKTNEKLQPFYQKKTSAKLEISTKENLKVTEAYLLYSFLSLIAEVGSYVGLFLGVSINQINYVFVNLFEMSLQSRR